MSVCGLCALFLHFSNRGPLKCRIFLNLDFIVAWVVMPNDVWEYCFQGLSRHFGFTML